MAAPFSPRLIMAATAALALPAAAQETAETVVLLDPITLQALDADGSAADRGASQYVAAAELERARMGDLKDLFTGIASVSVGGAIPVAQKIFINGVDMLNLSVTVDGVEQNNRAFHHVSANAIDPGLLKFVRVDAGVAAADAGPHAVAGAVVMETVDAADILEDGRSFGGNIRLSYGDNGRTFGRAATLAGQAGGFEWLGYLKSATGDDYKAGGGDRITGSAADLQSALLKLAYETPDGHRIELSGQRLHDDALRPYRANIGHIEGGRPVPELRRYDTSRTSWSLSYENTQAEGFWDPRFVIGRSESRVHVDQPTAAPPYVSKGDSDTFSAKLENRFHLNDADSVTAGVDWYDRSSTYSDPASALDENARNIGLYAQARLEPVERLDLSFGLRWDRQEFTGTSGWKDRNAGFSGNASVAYGVTDALVLRAGASTVFGGIAIEDNYIFNGAWDYDVLRPARARNYTLGFDYQAGDLRLDGELFLTQVDNARGGAYAGIENFDFESRGYNLGLGYGWDGGYLRASMSDSRVSVNGDPASSYQALDFGAPLGRVFSIEAQHTPLGSPFTYGGSIEAAAKYDRIEGDSDRTIPGYAVLNLFAEYAPTAVPGLVLRAEVANLFDKDYADRATYGGDYATVTPLREPGRTLSLVATKRF